MPSVRVAISYFCVIFSYCSFFKSILISPLYSVELEVLHHPILREVAHLILWDCRIRICYAIYNVWCLFMN